MSAVNGLLVSAVDTGDVVFSQTQHLIMPPA